MSLSPTSIQIIVISCVVILILLIGNIVKYYYRESWNIPNSIFHWNIISSIVVISSICFVITQFYKIVNEDGPDGPRGPTGINGNQGPPGISFYN